MYIFWKKLIRNLSYNETPQPCIKTKRERSKLYAKASISSGKAYMVKKLIEELFLRLRPHIPYFKTKGNEVYNTSWKTHTVIFVFLFYPITLEGRRGTTYHTTILFHLVLFSTALLSWQSQFLSTLWYCLPTSSSVCLFFFLFFLHQGVSRAEFSPTEPIPLQAVYVDHSRNPQLLYGSNRGRGKPRKQTALFQTVSYHSRKQQ